ncbi:MAG: hypothetical protein K5697_12795 [Lachnospiraceae bacterium]|nr:hypothetical protein [Lachnospiraceae bacterium]
MKKKAVFALLAALCLSDCGTKEEAKPAGETEVQASVTEEKKDQRSEKEEIPEEQEEADPTADDAAESDDPEEDADDGDAAAEIVQIGSAVQNEYFSAALKSYEEDTENDMLTVVFEFTNITGEMYYKSDEEIPAGGSWERSIMYTTAQWQKFAGKDNWIHYDLYDKEQNPLFSGGLRFVMDDELNVTEMEVFEEQPLEP